MDLERLRKSLPWHEATPPQSPRIERWRQEIHRRLSRYAFAVALLVYALASLRTGGTGPMYRQVESLPLVGLFGLSAFATSLGLRFRFWLLVGAMTLAGLLHIHHYAFVIPNGYITLMLASVVATLLLGTARGVVVLCATAGLSSLYGHQYVTGHLTVGLATGTDPLLGSNWARTTVVFMALTATCIASIGFLLSRLEREVQAGDRLVRAVADQSEQRISALETQNELERRLRQSQKMETVGLLAGGIAHDFNNLLTVILNNAELARIQGVPAKQAFDDIILASQRAAMLTRQLLAFSRRQISERKALALNPAVEQVLTLIRPLLPTHVNLRVELDPQVGYAFIAGTDIDQIVMNLCINAAEAMPDGGEVTVATGATERPGPDGDPQKLLHIDVSDTGSGIASEDQERIFDPFFTTKQAQRNTGMGLSVVHGLVTQSGGQIEVQSSLGSGSRFRILLPWCPPPESGGLEPESEAPGGDETLLVVDDDDAGRGILSAQLRSAGYHVIEACDGLEALKKYDEYAADVALVITDVIMPNMGGRALSETLIERNAELPLLLWSAYTGHRVSEQFLAHPLRGFLSKPFGRQQLLHKVRNLLDQARDMQPRDSEPDVPWTLPAVRRTKPT